jgi:single-strand DNA-binding protein
MSFAKVQLCGTLVSDAEKRFTPNNVGVTVFNLSVTNTKGQRGQETSFPVKITCWRGLADATEALQKNHVVLVEGRLQINSYTAPDGQAKKYYEVDASTVFVLPSLPQPLNPVSSGTATTGGGGGGYQAPASQNYGPAPAAAPAMPMAQATTTAAPNFELTDLSANDFLTEDDIPF